MCGAQRGMKIVAVDPRRSASPPSGCAASSAPGADGALALAMIDVVIQENFTTKRSCAMDQRLAASA